MPTFRSQVTGSFVTTQGSVMKRLPSSGQQYWIGRLSRVGIGPGSRVARPVEGGQLSARGAGSNRWMISLHGLLETIRGFAWRNSNAVPSNFRASRQLVGGFALR